MIGSWNEPGVRTIKMGVPAPWTPDGFQVNKGLYSAIRDSAFRGRSSENALDHLENFEYLCSVYRSHDLPLASLKLLLFPSSLKDEAAKWERATPSRDLSTWKDIEKEFLSIFFPKHLTAKIRREIANFKQRACEAFGEAWRRFSDYLRECPHHGFSKSAWLSIFYDGCEPHYRKLLDSSSGGSFSYVSVKRGEDIVRKIAKNDDQDRERTHFYTTSHGTMSVEEIHEDLNPSTPEQREISFCGRGSPHDDGSSQMLRDMNREDALLFSGRRPSNSFRSARQVTRPARYYDELSEKTKNLMNIPCYENDIHDIQEVVKSVSEGQRGEFLDCDEEMCNIERRANYRIEDLQSRQLELGKFIKDLDVETEREGANIFKEEQRVRSLDFCQILGANGYSQPKDDGAPNLPKPATLNMRGSTINTVSFAEPILHDTGLGFSVMTRGNPPKVDKTPDKRIESPSLEIPTICSKEDKEMIMVEAITKVLSAIKLMENFSENTSLLKNDEEFRGQYETLLAVRKRIEEKRRSTETIISEPTSKPKATTQNKDPSCFNLPCTIEAFIFPHGVINLNSEVNVMSQAVSKKLGLTNYEESTTSQPMVNESTRKHIGRLRNVPLQVKNHVVLTDFMVVDTESVRPDLITLGRPFLETTDALFYLKRGTLDLHLGPLRKKHTLSQFKDKPRLNDCANKISKLGYIRKITDLSDCVAGYNSRNVKTRLNNVVGNGAGTSKTSSSKDKGKGKMPDISEIDPGDEQDANPGDFSNF